MLRLSCRMFWFFISLMYGLGRIAAEDYSEWPNLPHTAFIYSLKFDPLCTGSLISSSLVLTSAMCIIQNQNQNGSEEKKIAMIGSTGGKETTYTARSRVHPKAEKKTNFYVYDLGVFYLEHLIFETKRIKEIWIDVFPAGDHFYDAYSGDNYTITMPLLRAVPNSLRPRRRLKPQRVKACSTQQRIELKAKMESSGQTDIAQTLNDGLHLTCIHHVRGEHYCAYDTGSSVITFASGNRPIFLGMISKTIDFQGCRDGPSSYEAELLTPVWVVKNFTSYILRNYPYSSAEMLVMTGALVITEFVILINS